MTEHPELIDDSLRDEIQKELLKARAQIAEKAASRDRKIIQLVANAHSGTILALTNDGLLYERDIDPRPQSGMPLKRYRWQRVEGPFDL